jgi:hypothetical protein
MGGTQEADDNLRGLQRDTLERCLRWEVRDEVNAHGRLLLVCARIKNRKRLAYPFISSRTVVESGSARIMSA